MRQTISLKLVCVTGMVLMVTVMSWAAPMVTEFTYQGRLTDGDQPANGKYDFIFRAYNAANNGAQVGSTVFKNDVPVNNGYFLVDLDFGSSVFSGDNRWIEISDVYYDYIALYGNNVIKPLIIIRFDDCCKSDLEIAAPYMDRYGLQAVSGIVISRPDDPNSWPNNMTWDEIARLKHDYGWQIANHSYSHMYLLSTIGYENNKAEVIKARDRLIEKGYGADCWLFIVPSGYVDVWPNPILTEGWADGMALVDSSLQYSSDPSHQIARQGPCPIPRMADPRVTGTTYSGMPHITAENLRTAVDISITNGGLNIFLFHRLVESNPTGSQTLAAAFREFIDYVALKKANGDLAVITYNDLRAGYLYK